LVNCYVDKKRPAGGRLTKPMTKIKQTALLVLTSIPEVSKL